MRTVFIYADAYGDYDYGATHPLKGSRPKLTHELIQAYGFLTLPSTEQIATKRAGEEDLSLFHTRNCRDVLKEANADQFRTSLYPCGLGPGENRAFQGVYHWSR